VIRQYEDGGLGLHVPSRNTGRGVHGYGKLKGKSLNAQGNQHAHIQSSIGEVRRLKGRGVIALRLETGRSSPGQGEARRKPGGSPKGC
jgi:hypothetical protein